MVTKSQTYRSSTENRKLDSGDPKANLDCAPNRYDDNSIIERFGNGASNQRVKSLKELIFHYLVLPDID